ncbi:hypothetical protein D3C72_2565870 [compost metagenome]
MFSNEIFKILVSKRFDGNNSMEKKDLIIEYILSLFISKIILGFISTSIIISLSFLIFET